MRHIIFSAGFPISARVRKEWVGIETESSTSVSQRPVDYVGVTGDPTDVSYAAKNVVRVKIENMADSHLSE